MAHRPGGARARRGRWFGQPECQPRQGIHDLTAKYHLDGVGEREPFESQVRLFVVRVGPADVGDAGRQVDAHALVAESGRRDDVDQDTPVARLEAGFLLEFPGGAEMRRLTVHVEEPRGQLPQPVTHRVAVLVHHGDVVALVERHDPHGTVVLHHLAAGGPVTRHAYFVGAQREDLPDVDRLAVDRDEVVVSHGVRARAARRHWPVGWRARRAGVRQPCSRGPPRRRPRTADAVASVGSSVRGGPASRR